VHPRIQDVEWPPPGAPTADYEVALVSLNQWQLAWRRFKKHKLALFGAALFLAMIVIAIVGPLFLPYDPSFVPSFDSPFCEGSQTVKAFSGCPPLTPGHPLGTTGRLRLDLLVLVVNGARVSLIVGIGAALISTIIGTIVGAVAGFFGGLVDNLLMRVVDVILSIPLLFVVIWLSKVVGNGDWRVILLVFSFLGWAGLARLVRSLFLSLRTEVFVDAARAVGVSDTRIIFRHILPNAMSPIIVSTTLAVAGFIITEAFVSFVGYGVDPAVTPTWGNILTGGQEFVGQGNWWWTFFPGVAIVITVLGINFMGDGLRDALDPRSRE